MADLQSSPIWKFQTHPTVACQHKNLASGIFLDHGYPGHHCTGFLKEYRDNSGFQIFTHQIIFDMILVGQFFIEKKTTFLGTH